MNYEKRQQPTKCTPAFLESYKKMILAGVKPITAARVAGVKDSTFYVWLKEAKEHSEKSPAAPPILEFLEITEQARAEYIAATIAKANLLVTTTSDALAVLKVAAPEEFASEGGERKDLTVNQLIVAIVRDVADIQRAALDSPAIIEELDGEIVEGEISED